MIILINNITMSDFNTLMMGFLTAFFVVMISMPSLIKVAKLKHLVDSPSEERKMHRWSIPTLGGVVIFGAIVFSYSLWFPNNTFESKDIINDFKHVISCLILLFFIGIKDDIIGTAPIKKLIAHIIVAFILVIMADIRIESMHGIFSIHIILPLWLSYLLTFFVYVVIINAINLIDGLDGLAGSISLISSFIFGILFYYSGDISLSLLAFVLAGTMLGFVFFNFAPARVFMGDAGSLSIGVILCVLAINSINSNYEFSPTWIQQLNKPVLAMSILVYPLIDTLRIFSVRIFKGGSPFKADKNHIHHKLLAFGFSHAKVTLLLVFYSLLILLSQLILQLYFKLNNSTYIFIAQVGLAVGFLVLFFVLFYIIRKNKN
jgi:UDP-GlcNAc:undecaprenyl-phosphate/decaprenyl-phosphate GlcNAc-1-phosphate transferase